jgi:hypothetical protein
MAIINENPKNYIIKQVINRNLTDTTLQPLFPKTVASQVILETASRVLAKNSFIFGGTYTYNIATDTNTFVDGTDGTTWSATVQQDLDNQSGNITITLPSTSGTLIGSVTDGVFDLSNTNGTLSFAPYTRITGTGNEDNTKVSNAANAGVFYTGSINPALITRLNYNGNFYASKLYSGGVEVVTSTSGSASSTGRALISAQNVDGVLTFVDDEFLHIGASGANNSIPQTVYGVKTFNSTIVGSVSGNAGTVTTSADNTTNASRYVLFADAVSGAQSLKTDTGLVYNPNTNTLTATVFSGAVSGNASSADQVKTLASTSTNAHFFTFVDANNDSATNEAILTSDKITILPSTGDITTAGDIAVNGGDITTTATSATVFNTNATTVDAFEAATLLDIGYIGAASSTTSISTGAVGTNNTKTINIGTGGIDGTTTINLGSSNNSTVNVPGNLTVAGNLTINNVEMVSTSNGVVFEGVSANDFETTLRAIDPTADNVIELQNASGTLAFTADIKNPTITITAGTDLATGGTFTLNQATDKAITLDHANVTRTADANTTVSPNAGGTITYVDGITSSATGHITAVTTKTATLPSYSLNLASVTNGVDVNLDASAGTDDKITILGSGGTTVTQETDTITITSTAVSNSTITIAAGNGLVTGGNFTLNGAGGTVTVDLGTPGTLSSSSTNEATADSHTHAITTYSLSGTANVVSVSGAPKVLGEASAITLLAGHGDTVNPYGVKAVNTVLAGPASGSTSAAPTFRSLVNADFPETTIVDYMAEAAPAASYQVVTVNRKGLVTAGAQLIQVGALPDANTPGSMLSVGGLFFEEVA